MRPRFEIETVVHLREGLIRDAVRWQVEAAALWADSDAYASRPMTFPMLSSSPFSIASSGGYRCAREFVEWILGRAIPCDLVQARQPRAQGRDAQKRQRRQEGPRHAAGLR